VMVEPLNQGSEAKGAVPKMVLQEEVRYWVLHQVVVALVLVYLLAQLSHLLDLLPVGPVEPLYQGSEAKGVILMMVLQEEDQYWLLLQVLVALVLEGLLARLSPLPDLLQVGLEEPLNRGSEVKEAIPKVVLKAEVQC